MLDLIIYALALLGFVWVGWDDRAQPFDQINAVPIAQEESRNIYDA